MGGWFKVVGFSFCYWGVIIPILIKKNKKEDNKDALLICKVSNIALL